MPHPSAAAAAHGLHSVHRCTLNMLGSTCASGMLEPMAGSPSGFEFAVRGERVEIRHGGRLAATLRKSVAVKFLEDVERDDPQQVMARVTGNYKRGNERGASRRP